MTLSRTTIGRTLMVMLTVAATFLTVLATAAPADATVHSSYRSAESVWDDADVWLYGDSLTTDDGGPFRQKVLDEKGWTTAIDAQGGRQTTPTVDILLRDLATYGPPPRLMMAVGTNNLSNLDLVNLMPAQINRVKAAVPASTKITWVTVYSDPESRPTTVRPYYVRNSGTVSNMIRAEADAHMNVADWHKFLTDPNAGETRREQGLRDGTHTTKVGVGNGRATSILTRYAALTASVWPTGRK